MQRGKGGKCCVAAAGSAAALALAILGGGCSTSINTPLPDMTPVGSTSLSQEQQKQAVEELNQKRVTHEQDAEAQIEQSR